MSDIKFSCSACGQHMVCDAQFAGRNTECPSCRWDITVPSASEAVALTPPPLSESIVSASLKLATTAQSNSGVADAEEISKSFEGTMQILGLLAILMGAIILGACAFLGFGKPSLPAEISSDMLVFSLSLGAVSGLLYLTSGIGALFKKAW